MQTAPPVLLPLLRSGLQARILALVLLSPDREWSLTEVAQIIGTTVSTVQREADRAEKAGVMTSRRLGNTRLVRAAPSPATGPLTQLLLVTFGPPQVVAEELGDVTGLAGLYIFGSWAARYDGVDGPSPADVDVLALGRPDRDELDEGADRARRRLGREVNVTVRSLDWWRGGDDALRTEILRRPLVTIVAAPETTGTETTGASS
ncbi:ArsR family transcriptional regulator [Lapillicoccus jejuensis]|uniref:ArsR family transcriptional regulator n=1 Tax=Lapillicoccus jejuensis TaxID=402171 RepID=A0A542DYQ0_9MICO|nr:ArsR family transcriptional regulator [Lapillicoccus jejuensis]TQJ08230.1 hypothetical protein FB458_1314 [Lapillicoccus jejuensis]